MINEGVTAISEAVSLQAKSYQPSVVGRMLEAQVRGSFTAMADDMILNGEEPPEAESLTYEGLLEMIDRFGLGCQPRNPYPPEHPSALRLRLAKLA
ncbi:MULTISPECIES: hypothetical protein [Vreelandella]|uniref:hypothetical protein n=1 Tax=Vreelandella TaxID=3137766 RepID=UPI00295ED8BF|nr:hypothetical protein [Halomonas venusta]MDW0357784.1 hypothetical protein [Halomonas venusta]